MELVLNAFGIGDEDPVRKDDVACEISGRTRRIGEEVLTLRRATALSAADEHVTLRCGGDDDGVAPWIKRADGPRRPKLTGLTLLLILLPEKPQLCHGTFLLGAIDGAKQVGQGDGEEQSEKDPEAARACERSQELVGAPVAEEKVRKRWRNAAGRVNDFETATGRIY